MAAAGIIVVTLEVFLKNRPENPLGLLDISIIVSLSDSPKSVPEIAHAHGLQERNVRNHVAALLKQGDIQMAGKVPTGRPGRTPDRYTISNSLSVTVKTCNFVKARMRLVPSEPQE